MSVVFERSNKGFSAERNLFATEIHFGFFTVLITREPIIERLVKMTKLYRLMKSGGEGVNAEADLLLREHAARGEVPVQRPQRVIHRSVPEEKTGMHK